MPLPKDWRAFIESLNSGGVEKNPPHQNRAAATSYSTSFPFGERTNRRHHLMPDARDLREIRDYS